MNVISCQYCRDNMNLAFLKVIIDTTFLDNSGKLIKKLAIFWQKSTLATTFNRENFTSMHK